MTAQLSELDQIDLITDSMVQSYSTYCSSCYAPKSSGEIAVDFAIRLFEEGWTASGPFAIKCPKCSQSPETKPPPPTTLS